jgi:hypothetical protein
LERQTKDLHRVGRESGEEVVTLSPLNYMDRQEFNKQSLILLMKVSKTLESKGVEYQKLDNVLSNFENNASDLGLTPYQIWSVYFSKHTKSIINAIKKNPDNPEDKSLSEPFEGRIIDAIAYLLLLNAMTKR